MKTDDMCFVLTNLVTKINDIKLDYNYYVGQEKIKIARIINEKK